jgi:glycosyltransferase involved in cell wall biosynthesis
MNLLINSEKPSLTVLMPVYNGAEFLMQAIESILSQTFNDFEFLIFNDGSTDESSEIIRSYHDERIRIFDYESNRGHVYHLNHGIEMAKGKYIARMDADDVSLPTRFMKQVVFMDNHPDVGACGTCFKITGTKHIVRHPTDDVKIRLALLGDSAIGHPTVMLRTGLLRQSNLRYDPSFVPAEDYLLWVMLSKFSKLANLPKILLHYRSHGNQISSKYKVEQQEKAQLVRNQQIETLLNRQLSDAESFLHSLLFNKEIDIDINENLNLRLNEWLSELVSSNLINKIYPDKEFLNFLKEKLNSTYRNLYLNQIKNDNVYTLKMLKSFWLSNHHYLSYFSYQQRFIFSLKCLLRYSAYK